MSAPPPAGPPPFVPPPDHPAPVWERSLADLEGRPVEKGAYGLGSIAWLARALVSPLRQLGPAELRLLLSQGRGLAYVLPLALARLGREPLAAGDYGPGDLLTAVLSVRAADAAWDGAWDERFAAVVRGARAALAERPDLLPEPARARLADDLDAAREAFGV